MPLRGDFEAGDQVVLDEGRDGALTFRKGERQAEKTLH